MDYALAFVHASQDFGQVTIPVGTDDEVDVREVEELLPELLRDIPPPSRTSLRSSLCWLS